MRQNSEHEGSVRIRGSANLTIDCRGQINSTTSSGLGQFGTSLQVWLELRPTLAAADRELPGTRTGLDGDAADGNFRPALDLHLYQLCFITG